MVSFKVKSYSCTEWHQNDITVGRKRNYVAFLTWSSVLEHFWRERVFVYNRSASTNRNTQYETNTHAYNQLLLKLRLWFASSIRRHKSQISWSYRPSPENKAYCQCLSIMCLCCASVFHNFKLYIIVSIYTLYFTKI